MEAELSHHSQTLCAASHSFSRTNRFWVFADCRQSMICAESPNW